MARGGDIMPGPSDEQPRLTPDWNSLPPEIEDLIIARLPIKEIDRVGLVRKSFHDVIKPRAFHQARARLRPTERSLSPLVFYAENDFWHLWGYDYKSRIWRKLPRFRYPIPRFRYPIPAPDRCPDLFQDFLVAGDKGLICANVVKLSDEEKLYIFNPLTGETFELPRLKFSRHPLILNVHVKLLKTGNTISSSFLVIAAGSAAPGTDSLSRKTEVFDSECSSGDWEVVGDIPGADFSLNDYQTGVYWESQNLLLCVGIMAGGSKGIIAFDAVKRQWREDWVCPLYHLHPLRDTGLTVHFASAQLVKCSEKIYVFTEQDTGGKVTLCIDRLDLDTISEGHAWSRMVTRQRQGNRRLLDHPEYTCVPVGKNKLCIFNKFEQTGWTYKFLNDFVRAGRPLPLFVMDNGIVFHSLNPVGYAFEPSFWASPFPRPAVNEEGVCAQGSGTELSTNALKNLESGVMQLVRPLNPSGPLLGRLTDEVNMITYGCLKNQLDSVVT